MAQLWEFFNVELWHMLILLAFTANSNSDNRDNCLKSVNNRNVNLFIFFPSAREKGKTFVFLYFANPLQTRKPKALLFMHESFLYSYLDGGRAKMRGTFWYFNVIFKCCEKLKTFKKLFQRWLSFCHHVYLIKQMQIWSS